MTDEKTATKTTPESTKRFRLTLAALKNVEDADDKNVRALIGEFQTFFQLYVDQRIREVEAREPAPFAGTIPPQLSKIQQGVTPNMGWTDPQRAQATVSTK